MSDDARPLWQAPEVPDMAPAPAVPEPRHDDGRPPLKHWWIGFAAFVAALVVTSVGVSVIVVIAGDRNGSSPGLNIASTYVQDAAFLIAAFVFARIASDASPRVALGLRRPDRPGRAAGIVVLLAVGFIVVSGIYGLLLDINDPSEQTVDNLGLRDSTVNLVVAGLLVAVVAPIVEEALFRGLLFGALWKRFGFWIGAIASGVAFGGIHIGGTAAAALPALMLLGFLFALVYKLTGSLIPAIFFHAINNGIALTGIVAWAGGQELLLVAGTVTLSTGLAWLISVPARSVLRTP